MQGRGRIITIYMPKMLYLSQRAAAWRNVKIGNTNLTIGDWGCLLTCISMLSSFLGCYISPDRLARTPGLFNARGELLWGELDRVFKGKLKFQWRHYGRDNVRIMASINGSPITVCVLQVNNGKHWVVATSVLAQGFDYMCADPIDGMKRSVLSRYPNITGSGHLIGA